MENSNQGAAELADAILEQARSLPLSELSSLHKNLGDLTRFETERARLNTALLASQIPLDQVKLIKYSERMPEPGDGEVLFDVTKTFEINLGSTVKTLSVEYTYLCTRGIETYVSVGYGSPARRGGASLWLNDRKGYSGSCSAGDLREVMEDVALELQKIDALSSAAEKDARVKLAEGYCDANDGRGRAHFPAWSPQDKTLIQVMETFIPYEALYGWKLDLSLLEIAMWGVGPDGHEWEH